MLCVGKIATVKSGIVKVLCNSFDVHSEVEL